VWHGDHHSRDDGIIMENTQAIKAELAAQRVLLARLYKICFLADPDARTQLPAELIGQGEASQPTGTTTDTLGLDHAALVRQELRQFFAAVELQVAEARRVSPQPSAL
jgi:hypothetical protein